MGLFRTMPARQQIDDRRYSPQKDPEQAYFSQPACRHSRERIQPNQLERLGGVDSKVIERAL